MNVLPAELPRVEEKLDFGPLRRTRAIAVMAGLFLMTGLFLPVSLTAQAWQAKTAPDFKNLGVPLYEQVTNRIKAKILNRLGEGINTQDRYFMIPFAYQNKGNDPGFSHSFVTVIRVLADNKQVKLTEGITTRTYQDRAFEAFTISWLPHDFASNPTLCVFKGFGARLHPPKNQCPMTPGKSFTLEETIQLAVNVKNVVCMWGPYEISQGGFDLGVKRLRLLESGAIQYLGDDRVTRKDRSAINCFHAMAGLYDLYPDGGLFGTGLDMWGINGTARVLMEYNGTASYRGLLLEPVDEKKDRYGFIYAESPQSRPYNPFKVSSAYRN